jgi:hypothetical protein
MKMTSRAARSDPSKGPNAAKVRRLIPKCSMCSSDTTGHEFAQIATTVISDENRPRVLALYDHVKKHEWNSLPEVEDFRGDLDTAIAYAVRGPHPGGIVVLTRDPTELWAGPEIYLQEMVTADEMAAISQLIPESKWTEL